MGFVIDRIVPTVPAASAILIRISGTWLVVMDFVEVSSPLLIVTLALFETIQLLPCVKTKGWA